MRVAVVGATGVVGRHVTAWLKARGHEVLALARDPQRLAAVTGRSVMARRADILDVGSLVDALSHRADAVIHAATAISRPGEPANWKVNDRIRREGTANLLVACRTCGISRYVQQSIAMLVPSSSDEWVDETVVSAPTTTTQSALDMEAMVAESGLDFRIVRGGALYGPGTGREAYWADMAYAGALDAGEAAGAYISLVHASDLARALTAALETDNSAFTVNAVDDEPVTYGELFRRIRLALAATTVRAGTIPVLPGFRASNACARAVMGWRPFFGSYRTGMLPQFVLPRLGLIPEGVARVGPTS